MKKVLLFALLLLTNYSFAQTSGYVYKGQMSFNMADSLFSPYLCSVDSTGNLWVASTNIASANAIHGLFKASPTDSVLSLVIAFTEEDSIRDITGITTIGNDVFVSTRMIAYSGYSTPYYYPFSQIIYLPNGDPSKRVRFKQPSYKDYGTWYSGLDASKDKHLYYGQSYLMTIGTIDGNKTSSSFGNSVTFARVDWSTPMEPGGDLTGSNFVDLIRDIALDKSGDYSDTNSVVYTSRNSSADVGAESKGGIARWMGGTSSDPVNYHAERINDVSGFLTIGNNIPNGIAVNPKNGYLFVCGTESAKKWVKGFQIVGSFAIQMDELPSSTSKDIPNAKGAPFEAPGDVAFNSDASVAYVTDEGTKKVYKFTNSVTGVKSKNKAKVNSFELQQNYPNPFNPYTNIVVKIDETTNIKAVVYNTYGEQVSVLTDGNYSGGTHILKFDGTKCASGIYICKVQAGNNTKSVKMVLMK